MEAKFKDGMVEVAGLRLKAPLQAFGQCVMFEAVKDLLHDDLERAARALDIPLGNSIATFTLMLQVAGVLQLEWFKRMGPAVPSSVLKNHEERTREYTKLLEDLKLGKVVKDMAKKEKKARAPKEPAKPLLYKMLASKVDAKLKTKIDNKETKNHDTIILQVLSHYDNPRDLDTIASAVKATGRYKTNDELPKSVRWHLNKLEKDGVVQAKEAA